MVTYAPRSYSLHCLRIYWYIPTTSKVTFFRRSGVIKNGQLRRWGSLGPVERQWSLGDPSETLSMSRPALGPRAEFSLVTPKGSYFLVL